MSIQTQIKRLRRDLHRQGFDIVRISEQGNRVELFAAEDRGDERVSFSRSFPVNQVKNSRESISRSATRDLSQRKENLWREKKQRN